MSISEWILEQSGPEDYELTDAEFEAVREYIHERMDTLPWELQNGLLKLINGENLRRLARDIRGGDR